MSDSDHVKLGFEIEVVQGDALEFEADVLAVKNTPYFSGVDVQINQKLIELDLDPERHILNDGSYWISGQKVSRVKRILFTSVGTNKDYLALDWLGYGWLRDLGHNILKNLKEAAIGVRHLALTTHGPGLGLDEFESFRSLLLGLADASKSGQYPATLERITFVDRDAKRVNRLRDALHQFLPPPAATPAPPLIEDHELSPRGKETLKETAETMRTVMAGPESFEPEFRKPEADDTTPHVFVAMPFRDTYDDQFYLAIQPTVKDQDLLCERMDLDTFTGDITDRMFARIRSAVLVIALLDGGNPNVYLEVGYAWGVGTQTVLLAHKEEPLPFDVRGHRVLIYDKIYLLKQMLEEELVRLLNT